MQQNSITELHKEKKMHPELIIQQPEYIIIIIIFIVVGDEVLMFVM